MRNQIYSLLAWCLVCAVAICTFLPIYVIDSDNQMDRNRAPLVNLTMHWEFYLGAEQPAEHDWRVMDQTARNELDGYRGTLWMKRPLPDLEWNNPYLFFSVMTSFEAFLDGERLYQFNLDQTRKYIHYQLKFHTVRISPEDAGKTLLIRANWEGHPLFGYDQVMQGELDQMLYLSLKNELHHILYALLSVVTGIVGLLLWLRNREALYGWFTLLALALGLALLLSARTLQWMVHMDELYYWQGMMTPLAIWGSIGYYFHALQVSRRRVARVVHLGMSGYVLLLAAVSIANPVWFRSIGNDSVVVVAFTAFAVITWCLVQDAMKLRRLRKAGGGGSAPATPQQQERKWLLRGYWTFTICALLYLGLSSLPAFMTELLMSRHYFYRVIEGLMPNSLLLFMICLAMFMVSRVRRVHKEAEQSAAELLVKNRELEQFQNNLERLVEQRTTELERANRSLALTLREKAETLAEMSVLEERNRIANEMHDVVGHTLTAAIVQLEATKRLTLGSQSLPVEKLDLLSELVRKGLDDIRRAVRLMKTDEEPALPLDAALQELMQYAEDTMEITVASKIVLPPGLSLGKVTETVIYHALQEGLTNGIRHGQSRHFQFTLRVVRDELQFILTNDGLPLESEEIGFGLSSMAERVQMLGGKVALRSRSSVGSEPKGCELAISLPLS